MHRAMLLHSRTATWSSCWRCCLRQTSSCHLVSENRTVKKAIMHVPLPSPSLRKSLACSHEDPPVPPVLGARTTDTFEWRMLDGFHPGARFGRIVKP
jgi:hypothetical protein